jgi:hypothetical protein
MAGPQRGDVTQVHRSAAARPDAFLPGLAMSLNNLSNRLGALGRREDGLAAISHQAAELLTRPPPATQP